MREFIMAIDQGTTSTRAIIFDKNQKVVAIGQKEVTNFFPEAGWVEQDANEIWLSVLGCMADVFGKSDVKPGEIKAIGITNQRETTVVWDKVTGLPVYNAIVWQSRQTTEIINELKAIDGLEEKIRAKTGLLLDPYFSASKIKWILDKVDPNRENENLLFGTIDTWLVWKMTCGKVHTSDVTNASRTLLFNIHDLCFDDELLEIFNVPRRMLPSISDTSAVIGNIEAVHFFGCNPIIGSMVGDQQSALFGQSCFKKGEIKNTYGTGGFILMNTGKDITISDKGLLTTVAWKIDDTLNYAIEGSIFVSGSLIQWLRDGLKFFKDAKETSDIAYSVDSTNGVYIVPAFTGLGAPYWDDEAKGSIFGLTRGTTDAHLVRASLESMAYQCKDLMDLMQSESGINISALKVDGGASKNDFLLQFQSDILLMNVLRSSESETTALGAARLAGLAVGYYQMSDFESKIETLFSPKREAKEVIEKYSKWQKAVKCCMEFK